MEPCAIYIHIPFCESRCHYCDFATSAGLQVRIPEYITALTREIDILTRYLTEPVSVRTIFVGGGTPSLVPMEEWGQVMDAIKNSFILEDGAEITLEANPRTASKESLVELRRLGFNRISLGMQSADPKELRLLGRIHEFSDVQESVSAARAAGFTNLNLDLIHGLPGQNMERWVTSLEAALNLSPEHLSIYGLTIESGTPFDEWLGRGLLQKPDDDLAADQYEWARERLDGAGFLQYEISNWAAHRNDTWMECRHNLQYWRYQPYLGFGMAAHGFIEPTRVSNNNNLEDYLHLMAQEPHAGLDFPVGPASQSIDHLRSETRMQEYMMVGLRLVKEGVSRSEFEQRFQMNMDEHFQIQINRLRRLQLIEDAQGDPDRLRLTRSGVLLGNVVFREFVGD